MSQQLTFNVDLDTQQAINGINRFFDTFEQGAFKAKSRLQQEWQKPIELDVEVKFKNGKLAMTEYEFNIAWGQLLPEIVNEIHEKVLEVNPTWGKQGEE